MVQVIWTEWAQVDFDEIFHYYDSFSSKVAISYSEEVIRTTDWKETIDTCWFFAGTSIYLFENDVCQFI